MRSRLCYCLQHQLPLVVHILVVLPQIDDGGSPYASCPIGEEGLALLLLHVLQVGYDLQATILDHFVLHILGIVVEMSACHNPLGKHQHHLPHFLRDNPCGFPSKPLFVNLLAGQISFLLHNASSFIYHLPFRD